MKYRISVVIPIYNEEQNINKSLNKLVPLLEKKFPDYEIVLVESGSTDNSASIADNAAKNNRRIKVIHQRKRLGYGNAIRTGLEKCSLDVCIYSDCDLPYDFKNIVEATKYIGNYDAVIGYKLGKRESIGRYILSFGGKAFARIFFGIKVKDVGFPFKLMRTKLVKRFRLVSDTNFIPVEILLELKKNRAKIKEMPIQYRMRKIGNSKVISYFSIIKDYLADVAKYMKKKIE